jgi:hypothetical protein
MKREREIAQLKSNRPKVVRVEGWILEMLLQQHHTLIASQYRKRNRVHGECAGPS